MNRSNLYLVLAARLLLFTLVIVWTLLFIIAGLNIFNLYADWLGSGEIPPVEWFQGLMQVWYLVTLIIIASLAARLGFRAIGRWEKQEDENSED